jgi:hypothetical protein
MRIKLPQSIHSVIAKYEKAIGLPVKERGPSKFGWSSVGVYQTCPFLFANKERVQSYVGPEGFNREVGNVVHWLNELRYGCGKIIELDLHGISEALLHLGGNKKVIEEGFRVFAGYQAFYGDEPYMRPIAVETELFAASIKKTYRLDLLFRSEGHPDYEDGVYFMDHKTASAITEQLKRQWDVDGQVLTGHHAALYGDPPITDYRGLIINIIGKQKKEQKFERILCTPDPDRLAMFKSEIEYWDAQIAMSKATGVYPRKRASSCSGKYSMCDLYHEC